MSDRVDALVDALRDILAQRPFDDATVLVRAALEAYESPGSADAPERRRTLSETQSIDVYGHADMCCAADNFVSISARHEHPTTAPLSNDPVDW